MEKDPAQRLVEAIQARGSNARDVRDAAHEASHALELRIPEGQWDRKTIHMKLLRLPQARRAGSEMLARAVEAEVCRRLGVPYEPGGYMVLSVIEALESSDVTLPREFPKHVEEARRGEAAQKVVSKLLEFCSQAPCPV